MTRPLVILGTGGSAYDVLDIVEAINRVAPMWDVAGFLDDSKEPGSTHLGLPILGRLADAIPLPAEYRFVNVIGSDKSFRRRPDIVRSTGLADERFATLIHPLAVVSTRAKMGRGVYAAQGVSVGGAVTVGDHVSLSPGVIIGHDSVIESFSLLAPAAVVSGHCRVGAAAYVGAGATVRQCVRVGERALVGMGAVVLRDVSPESIVVGNPAKSLAGR